MEVGWSPASGWNICMRYDFIWHIVIRQIWILLDLFLLGNLFPLYRRDLHPWTDDVVLKIQNARTSDLAVYISNCSFPNSQLDGSAAQRQICINIQIQFSFTVLIDSVPPDCDLPEPNRAKM